MKIQYFKLDNFKSFKDSNNEVSRLNDINFIYGHNNSGKSNILKFLSLIFKTKYKATSITTDEGTSTLREIGSFLEGTITNEPFIYHMNKQSSNIKFTFKISVTKLELQLAEIDSYNELENEYFNHDNDVIEVKFSGTITRIDEDNSDIKLDNAYIDDQEAFSIDNRVEVYFKDKASLVGNSNVFKKLMSYFNDCIIYIDNDRYFITEAYNTSAHELTSYNFKNWLYKLSIERNSFDQYHELLEFIRKHKIGKLIDLHKLDLSFSIDYNNNIEIMLNKNNARLPISSFGTGINQILYILTKIFVTNARIILIEELELNLSPNSQREFFLILKNLIAEDIIDQVIFTTHSPFFNFRSDFSIYEVTIDRNRISSVKRKVLQSTAEATFWRNEVAD